MHQVGGVPPKWTSGICWYVVVGTHQTSTTVLQVWLRALNQMPILLKVRPGARSDCGFHECVHIRPVLGTWTPLPPLHTQDSTLQQTSVVSATEAATMFYRFGVFFARFVRSPLAQVRGFLCGTTGISHIPLLAACRQIATAPGICYNWSSRSSIYKI